VRAVLERDFLSQALRPRAFVARTAVAAAAAGAVLLSVLFNLARWNTSPDLVGAQVFRVLGMTLLVALTVVTPSLVVGSVVGERVRGTLPVLLTTPVSPAGIALGKFLSRTGTALLWAATALPPLSVAILLGGVSGTQVVNLALTVPAVVIELSAWALLLSCTSRTVLAAALLVYFPPALRWCAVASLGQSDFGQGTALPFLLRSTTALDLFRAGAAPPDAPGFAGAALAVAAALPGLVYLLFSAGLAAVVVALSGRALAAEEEVAARLSLRVPQHRGEARWRVALSRGNPIAWKDSLLLGAAGSRTLFYVMAAMFLAAEAGFLLYGAAWVEEEANIRFVAAMGSALAFLAAVNGAAAISHEKTQGTLGLLRLSRLTPRDVTNGKALGNAAALAWLGVVPLCHLALVTGLGIVHPLVSLVFVLLLAFLCASYTWLGMRWGIVAQAPWSAVAGAASIVAVGAASCSLACLLPVVLFGVVVFRARSRELFRAVILPGMLTGPVYGVLDGLTGSLARALADEPGRYRSSLGTGGTGPGGMFLAVFLVSHAVYLHTRMRENPILLAREMERWEEGGEPAPRITSLVVPPQARRADGPPPGGGT